MKTTLILNDTQIENYSRALYLVMQFSQWLKPSGIVLNGDIVDLYALSRFTKNPAVMSTITSELDMARDLILEHLPLEAVRRWWIGGNHEDRYRRYIWDRAPDLVMTPTKFEKLARCREYGLKWLEYGEGTWLGKLFVTHGDLVRRHSAYTARAHFERYGVSTLIGHTHRLGQYYHRNRAGVYGAYENGCLCSLQPEFDHYPDWQHGFAVVQHDEASGIFNVEQCKIFEETWMIYGGRKFYLTNRDKMRVQ